MNYYLTLGLALFVYMTGWFVVSQVKKRNDIADIAWGLGFILLSLTAILINGGTDERGYLAFGLVTVWGVRLARHIWARNKNKAEDYRYAAWRKEWGRWFVLRSFIQVYLLQGIFLYLICLPVLFVIKNTGQAMGWMEAVGAVVWITGFIFESVGDSQLARFISNPQNKGKIIQSGLWRYTRHPNYFGEVTQWWGLFILGLALPSGWQMIVGPMTITILILFVSGIPLLEKKYAGRVDFEDYKKRTSIFFPWFPKEK